MSGFARLGWVVGLWLVCASGAEAALVAKPVEYAVDDVKFRGHVVYDDAVGTPRPGVFMVPNWYGAGDKAVEKAKGIAKRDYVVFVADLFGESVRPADDTSALATVRQLYGDRALLQRRVVAAMDAFRGQIGKVPVARNQFAAIGFCFGGMAVLDLARSGADLAAVVTFHGDLSTPDAALVKGIRARVLVLNGADDAMVTPQVAGFEKEMREAKVDWQFVDFGGAVHCFTEVGADSEGCRYDARTSERAYRLMRDWLAESSTR